MANFLKQGRDDKDFKWGRKIALRRMTKHWRSSETKPTRHRRNDDNLDDSLLDSLDSNDDFVEEIDDYTMRKGRSCCWRGRQWQRIMFAELLRKMETNAERLGMFWYRYYWCIMYLHSFRCIDNNLMLALSGITGLNENNIGKYVASWRKSF